MFSVTLLDNRQNKVSGRLRELLKKQLSVFFSAGTARSAIAWPPVNCACVPQLFEQLIIHLYFTVKVEKKTEIYNINTKLCPACFGKLVCQPFRCVPLQLQTFFIKILSSSLNVMLIVDKHCSDVCGDEFPMSQIDRKSK